MYGQLADLIGSGVPLLRALDSLVKSTVNSRLREVLKDVRASVADGKSLTGSMRDFPNVFPSLHLAMVQAGERASFLEDVLRSLSGFLERLEELRSKVLGAMIYPALLTFVGLTVLVGALIFFVPRFEPLLSGVHQALPTQLLFALSHAVEDFGTHTDCAGRSRRMLWSGLKSETGKRLIEEWRLRLPVGTALRMVAITRFCRILGTMLANGVPCSGLGHQQGLDRSPCWRIALRRPRTCARQTLTEPLRKGGLFPEQVIAMITVAEESNQLEKVLLHIADTVERRTNRQVDQAVRLVEPLILCGSRRRSAFWLWVCCCQSSHGEHVDGEIELGWNSSARIVECGITARMVNYSRTAWLKGNGRQAVDKNRLNFIVLKIVRTIVRAESL